MSFSQNKSCQRHVDFSTVVTHYFDVLVDGSKLPANGCAPIGLGHLRQTVGPETLDSYEERRIERRNLGQLHMPHSERLAMLSEAEVQQLPEVEAENALLLVEEVSPSEQCVPPEATNSMSTDATLVAYGTARYDEKRTGIAGGFLEVDHTEEEERRKCRALEERQQAIARKSEKRRCIGCRRFACIC